MARVQVCKGEFLLAYSHGRPREHCYDCVPQGFRFATVRPGKLRLRRTELPSNVNAEGN
jgi:hypothetical protein